LTVNEKQEKFKSSPEEEGASKKTVSEYAMLSYEKVRITARENPGAGFTPHDTSKLTGRSHRTENRYLKELSEAGLLERVWEDKKYKYKIAVL
jgi:Fic family protein